MTVDGRPAVLDDSDRELGTVVSYLIGRHVTTSEIVDAMGVSRSGYYVARNAGRLITADHLLAVATHFGLNPIELMVRFGLLSEQTAVDYVDSLAASASRTTAPRTTSSRARRLRRRPDSPPL